MAGLPAIKKTLNDPRIMSSIVQRIGENNFRDFSSSVLELVSSDSKLQECEPNNLIQECLKAAALRLPLSKNLGFAYVIPYKVKGKMTANYQTGYKGLIQLAIRSGQFKHLNAGVVYEGEEIIEDRIKGTFEITGEKKADKAIGYFSYMSLLNGFEKGLFWTKEKCHEHGKKYSKAYNYSSSVWQSDPDAMCIKTVLLQLISKYAPLSVEMQTAFINDSSDAIFNEDNTPDFSDANTGEIIDIEEEKQELEFEEKADVDKKEAKDESSAFAEPEY
jgi:recombination protein RecT